MISLTISAASSQAIYLAFNSNQPTNELLPRSVNNEGWLLLRLEALFCSIHLLYEGLISILSKRVPVSIRSRFERTKNLILPLKNVP